MRPWAFIFAWPNQGSLGKKGLSKPFGVDLQLTEQVCRETELHTEKVRRKKQLLKRLIVCVFFGGGASGNLQEHE